MRAGAKSKTRPKHVSLVGTWFSGDEYGSEVEFTITRARDSFAVAVTDSSDGERADVFETAWDGKVFTFAAHWNSTGRFARYRLALLSATRLHLIYTYTEQVTYRRKRTKRDA